MVLILILIGSLIALPFTVVVGLKHGGTAAFRSFLVLLACPAMGRLVFMFIGVVIGVLAGGEIVVTISSIIGVILGYILAFFLVRSIIKEIEHPKNLKDMLE